MRAAPLISIVVPCCNHGRLAEALRSVTSLPTRSSSLTTGPPTQPRTCWRLSRHRTRSARSPSRTAGSRRPATEGCARVVAASSYSSMPTIGSRRPPGLGRDGPGRPPPSVRSFRPLHDDGPRRHPAHDSPLPEDPARSLPGAAPPQLHLDARGRDVPAESGRAGRGSTRR